MPVTIYPGSENSVQYQLLTDGQTPISVVPGTVAPCPDEYQPISLTVSENLGDIFIEPEIEATYFVFVDLSVGSQWIISDVDNRVLYLARVMRRVSQDDRAGTVSYRFTTLMSYLANAEPAGILTTVKDALGSDTATPNQVLSYIFGKWDDEIKGLSLGPNVPVLELRGADGPIVPFVYFIAVDQDTNPKSFLAWLEELLGTFEGYGYRLDGSVFRVLPPYWQQTASIDVSEAPVLSVSRSKGDDIINSQTVKSNPTLLAGTFEYDEAGDPLSPSDLPEIANPVYYRQNSKKSVPPPTNREYKLTGQPTLFRYSAERIPVIPPVRVTWTTYVFLVQKRANDTIEKKDVSDGLWTDQTFVIDMQAGEVVDVPTIWKEGFLAGGGGDWAWRLEYMADGSGVRAILLTPDEPQTLPDIPALIGGGLSDRQLMGEWYLDVQGQAYEKSQETYTATYGVYTPPTMPPGVDPPPVETAGQDDAQVASSYAIFGKRAGPTKDLGIWTLVSAARPDIAEVLLGYDPTEKQTLILKTLLDIAQHAVKENILPYEDVELTFARPLPLSAAQIGYLVTYEGQTGAMRSYGYSEVHTLQGSDVTAKVGVRVRETTERLPITFIPVDPTDPTPIPLPGGPPEGGYPPLTPSEPVTAGPGMVQIELGNRFDLLKIVGTAATRIRLYRTAAARTSDASRPVEEFPSVPMEEALILEAVLTADNLELDLHAILGWTEEGVVYANIQNGSVTFHRFLPDGTRV